MINLRISFYYICITLNNKKNLTLFIQALLIAILIVAVSLLGLGIMIFGKKNGAFPVTSIGKNIEMSKRGITCPKHDEIQCYKEDGRTCSC